MRYSFCQTLSRFSPDICRLALFSSLLLSSSSSVLAEESEHSENNPSVKNMAVKNPEVQYRQIPGEEPRPTVFEPYVYESYPDINSSSPQFVPVPDRWRQFYAGKWYDPYNQNEFKGDLPVFGEPGEEWFLELSLISETLLERRELPTPVGFASTTSSDSTDVFGNEHQTVFQQTFVPSFALIRGNTTFKPPELEFRFVPAINFNQARLAEVGALRINPEQDESRDDFHLGINELFLDYHLANLSERYDFISSRVGIQKFTSDFRGFVYSDEQPGARLFGNWDNNKYQYNLAWFSRLDKDTNSGINTTFSDRHEDVYLANIYRQDAFALGQQAQLSYLYRADTAGDYGEHYDQNGFLVRPAAFGDERGKNVYTNYFGFNTDGHISRLNTSTALYYACGSESHNPIAGQAVEINAGLAAAELSYDIDWIRLRTSALWASGDGDPFDRKAEGFDAIFDNPNFAGGDLGYFQRQGIPFVGGGGVNLVNRSSLYPDLRAGKEEGQSNFVNPGLRLLNLGADFTLLPELKLITNASYLQFDETAVLEALRQDGSIARDIGFDLSAGLLYRPFLNNNVQVRLGAATLLPAEGMENLFGKSALYDVFTNLILQY